MYKSAMLAIAGLLLAADSHADRYATTDDGARVVLREDGSWRPSEPVVPLDSSLDFRRTRWGMSSVEVARSESLELLGPGDLVAGDIGGQTVRVGYVFEDDRLVGSLCRLPKVHTEDSPFRTDFDSLKVALVREYGDPVRDDVVWMDDRFRDYSQFYGTALSLGHVEAVVQWETARTLITLLMRGHTYPYYRDLGPIVGFDQRRGDRQIRPIREVGADRPERIEYQRRIMIDLYYEDKASDARAAFRDLVHNRP